MDFLRPLLKARFAALVAAALIFGLNLSSPSTAAAQATAATGSIEGIITDPAGAAVPNAKITITNKDTGAVIHLTATGTGEYNSGSIGPGTYTIRVEAPNFKTTQTTLVVQVGVVAPGNIKLEVGSQSTVVEVTASAMAVNSEQASIQGVLDTQQIENLPVNGRNFLDLAQLEPGVQIQDGSNFDPTKTGFSSISFGGRFGRTARIEVDGVDVSDETVGTTTEDIPASSIREFQLAQSSLDMSSELTSSGEVNVVTQSGTNKFHGEAFDLYRNNKFAAGLPAAPGLRAPFERSQFGGNIGGPIWKDKLFFFGDAERTVQNFQAPIAPAAPFTSLAGNLGSPFREGETMGRVDYNAPHGIKLFYRFSYFKAKAIGNLNIFGANSFQPFHNIDQTRQHVVGSDFITGSLTHSFRFSWLKFRNDITDATVGSGLPLANFPLAISIGTLSTGPNFLAPQGTPQSNHQFKYDGSWTKGSHIVRYGFDFNHIQGGGFASFSALAANVNSAPGSSEQAFAMAQVGVAGCPALTAAAALANPLCWPMDFLLTSSGVGFSTTQPALGFPFGGLGPDNRIGLYLGDTWKIRHNLTLTFGARYVRDTGRTDSDLPPIAALNNALPGAGLGNRINQPNTNLGPQAGIAWDPRGNGKTVIRIGAGLYYENVIFNNVLFDRPLRLTNGAFLQNPTVCSGGAPSPVPFGPNGPNANQSITIDQFSGTSGICGENIGAAAPAIVAFQNAYIQSNGVNPATLAFTTPLNPNHLPPNPAFVANFINAGVDLPLALFAPGYTTPSAFQFNAGVQREIRRGMVLSVDYLRNVGTHYLLGIDANHTGDVRSFKLANAQAAIAATLSACGVSTIDQAIGACPGLHPAMPPNMPAPGPATMADFATFGLDSQGDVGSTCQAFQAALGTGTAIPCAFGGKNPNAPSLRVLYPVGRSVYNALQVKLAQQVSNPFRGVPHLNLQVAYSLSRLQNAGSFLGLGAAELPSQGDQDFVLQALDSRNPLRFLGDSALDRRHQLSFGGFAELRGGFVVSAIGHYWSPLSSTLYVPFTGTALGEIFRTNFTGDGTVQDVLPGTQVGSFGRSISNGNLNAVITNYNNTFANQATPAGQVLIKDGLFTLAQLQALGGVAPRIPLAPPNEVGLAPLKVMDLKVAWHHSFHERFTIEPSVGFFNIFNYANFDLPTSTLSGSLTGAPGAVNGTMPADRLFNRVGIGTGVFSLGAPRTVEFGMKFSF